MKQPVLHVKKGAVVYDDTRGSMHARAESTGERTPPPRRRRRSVRRGMTFLPLAVVALALAAALQLASPRDTARFTGWDARLRVVPYEGTLLYSLTFTPRPEPGQESGGTAAADATIVLPDTGASVDLSGSVGPEETTLRGQMLLPAKARRVRADVTIGGERRSLSAALPAGR